MTDEQILDSLLAEMQLVETYEEMFEMIERARKKSMEL